MSERMKALVRAVSREVSKDMKALHQWVARIKGDEDTPDPRCCLKLSPRECSQVPSRICRGLEP